MNVRVSTSSFQTRMRLLLVLLVLFAFSKGHSEDYQRYLLPDDEQPFKKEVFDRALEQEFPWELPEYRRPLRSGDLSQRATWGGTLTDFKVDFWPKIHLAMIDTEDPSKVKETWFKFNIARRGIEIKGPLLEGSIWEDDSLFRIGSLKGIFRRMVLPDGSALLLFAPKPRWPDEQGAMLLCTRPAFRKLTFNKREPLPKIEAATRNEMRFVSLDFTYDLDAEYISGTLPVQALVGIFTDKEVHEGLLKKEEIFVRNPHLELYGESKGELKKVPLNKNEVTRTQLVSQVVITLDGGRQGVFLQHQVFEFHPAPERAKWVTEYLRRIRDYQAPYEGYGQCAYLVTYTVKRDIYQTVKTDKKAKKAATPKPKRRESYFSEPVESDFFD